MQSKYDKLEEMWARQQISSRDVDYKLWIENKNKLRAMSEINRSLMFTVDVYRKEYNFASASFSDLLGFSANQIEYIEKEGDFIEDHIHPEDLKQLLDIRLKHSQFIYSLPSEKRNDYRNIFRFRIRNKYQQYIYMTSSQQVLLKDKNEKAWIIAGTMEISPDQAPQTHIGYSVVNIKSGEINSPNFLTFPNLLTFRETEVLQLIHQGLLSKEIAQKLNISIHTVNNHRKNVLSKLSVDNSIEAINSAKNAGIL